MRPIRPDGRSGGSAARGKLIQRALTLLAALLIPLSKIVPPIYVWRVRSRVYRWYGELRKVEQELEGEREVSGFEERVNHISIPLAYAEELYRLRSHINFMRERVRGTIDRNGIATASLAKG